MEYKPNVVLSTEEFNVVGTRPIRHDGADKVTGRAPYGADFDVAGLLHGKVLRSPHAHARIKSIDISKALALPGVKAVITAKDLPFAPDKMADLGEGATNLKYLSNNILALDKVLYKGHAIAAVAATSPHVAEEALLSIDVEYEVLPPVLNVLDAMKEDAPLLQDDVFTSFLGGKADKPSNIASHLQFQVGDIEKGFQEADVIVEREYHMPTVHQGYIEPQNATALWNADGKLTIWCSTQGAFVVRSVVSEILDIPVSSIKVVPMEIGGGFGGKIPVYLEPLAAVLSRKSGHPVKLLMNRAEVFESTGPTCGSYGKVKVGATKDGRITAAQAYLAYEAGGYPGALIGAGTMCIFAPYKIENGLIDGYDVLVNKPKSAAYRAPGAPNAAYPCETVMDEICEKIGMDPIEFRLRNAATEGTRRIDGPVFPRIGLVEVLEATKDHPHYSAPLEGPNKGRGMASGFWFNIGLESSCNISLNTDGTVSLVEGSTDIGGTRVAVAMQAAEVLGIAAEDVKPVVADTDSVGYTALTGGSRTAFATGWAAYEAAQELKKKLIERAATIWDTSIDEVEYVDGVLSHKSDPELRMTFKELAGKTLQTGGPISSTSNVNPKGAGGAFATVIVDVEVDPDTGKVDVLRYTTVQDAGKAIHPSYVEGQMQGGAVQGIGWALNEEYFYNDSGEMVNSSFLDYRMPTSLDLPMIDTVIVEVANPGHPFGARGVGEVPIVPPVPAIANAIHNAIGVRMNSLPMNPGKVLEALWEKDGKKSS